MMFEPGTAMLLLSGGLLNWVLSSGEARQLISSLRESILAKTGVSENSQEQIARLSASYNREELVLVLGAGVSADYRIPTWPELLQGMLIRTLQGKQSHDEERISMLAKLFAETFEISPLIAARYLRLNASDERFEEAVRSVLYSRIKTSEDSSLVKEIRQLAAAPGRSPNLDSILTYNFDDVIETALGDLDVEVPFQVIDDMKITSKPGFLPIYHVHGYLPRSGPLAETKTVTLTEDSYHTRYAESYDWSSLVQINKYREKTCLFLGTSFSDPNLRRLLDVARQQRGDEAPQHVLVRRRQRPGALHEAIKNSISSSLGKDAQGEDGGRISQAGQIDMAADQIDEETIQIAKELVQLKQDFEETDAASFGVSTLWVEGYNDIPRILRAIRGEAETKGS